MTSVTSVISLDFCTKSFENVHLTCENSTKANKKKMESQKHRNSMFFFQFSIFNNQYSSKRSKIQITFVAELITVTGCRCHIRKYTCIT